MQNDEELKDLNPSEGIAIFTDGSATTADKDGGWAWVAVDAFNGLYHESGFCKEVTNNQMELYAVARALHAVWYDYEEYTDIAPNSIDILLFSDSEYVVLGLNNKSRKRNKNHKYWRSAEQYIGNYNSVTFEHVRGHNGNEYNELADQLAGEARRSNGIEEGCSTETPEVS